MIGAYLYPGELPPFPSPAATRDGPIGAKEATMLIRVEQNRMGDVTLAPVNPRWARAIVRYLRSMNAIPVPESDDDSVWAESCRDGSVYLQGDAGEMFITEDLPAWHRTSVREGWPVTIRMDAYSYLTMIGYDAADSVAINTARKVRR